jgi:hypothetical protein
VRSDLRTRNPCQHDPNSDSERARLMARHLLLGTRLLDAAERTAHQVVHAVTALFPMIGARICYHTSHGWECFPAKTRRASQGIERRRGTS